MKRGRRDGSRADRTPQKRAASPFDRSQKRAASPFDRSKGKPLSIPRSDVSRLIWLHPENLETPWTPPQPQGGQGLFVESVSGSTQRLRMMATGIEGNLLVGTSPVVGPCRIDLEKIERLLIGRAIDNQPRSPPYAQWKLQPAPEPRNLPPRNP